MKTSSLKWFSLFFLILFLGFAITPDIFALKIEPQNMENILYVGGDGPGNYSTIRQALDNASNGDTIYVFSGIYGRFDVKKSVKIIGENKFTTIIDAKGKNNAIYVRTDNFILNGFTIQEGSWGIDLQNDRYVMISDMIIKNNGLGIKHNWNRDVLIHNISFINNDRGIELWDAHNCTVTHCIFNNNKIDHSGFPPSGNNSLYIRNNLFINDSPINLGNRCLDSHGITVIESNIFQDNQYAIITDTCKGVIIKKNNFINSNKHILLRKYSPFFFIPLFIDHKQEWGENYWDDLGLIPIKKIIGEWQYSYFFPILHFHYREYELNPARKPYNITVLA